MDCRRRVAFENALKARGRGDREAGGCIKWPSRRSCSGSRSTERDRDSSRSGGVHRRRQHACWRATTTCRIVLKLAAEGKIAGERFIRENESSYKLDGKVQASLDRNAAVFADIAGWALYLQGDLTARRSGWLKRPVSIATSMRPINSHLAELSRKKNDLENAREHYLTALGLAGITPPQRDRGEGRARRCTGEVRRESGRVRKVADRHARSQTRGAPQGAREQHGRPKGAGVGAEGSAGQQRRPARRARQRDPVEFLQRVVRGLQGGVTAHPEGLREISGRPKGVKFILVSLDDDPARLDRYVAERKFAMPVARYIARAGRAKCSTFTTRRTRSMSMRSGTIRYQVTGVEPHGDAVERVTWYIEQLKGPQTAGSSEGLSHGKRNVASRCDEDRPGRGGAWRSREFRMGAPRAGAGRGDGAVHGLTREPAVQPDPGARSPAVRHAHA